MRRLLLALCAQFLVVSQTQFAGAQQPTIEGLKTNQSYVDAVTSNQSLNIADPKSVFAAILKTLPDRVKVYPTESYYYFSFHHGGVRYAGNIRLDAQARKVGKLYFTYFRSATAQHGDGEGQRALLGAEDGVDVKAITPLNWRVSHAGRSVVFMLNDLSKVKPPAGLVLADERYIGPVFDESGLRFFLLFDDRSKEFLFVLDETGTVPEEFLPSEGDPAMRLGRRTGFLFYLDKANVTRKVLIGVFAGNVELNNYFDGPFDQLPDSFIVGDSLREAILKQRPDLKGRIDRFGNLEDGEKRVLIAPYATYQSPDDLAQLAKCISKRGLPVDDNCLADDRPQGRDASPEKQK